LASGECRTPIRLSSRKLRSSYPGSRNDGARAIEALGVSDLVIKIPAFAG
jgi:hypothetical protein